MKLFVGLTLMLTFFSFKSQAKPKDPRKEFTNRYCIEYVESRIKNQKFGNEKPDKFDDEDLSILCTLNTGIDAFKCISDVSKEQNLMHPIGLAEVCSRRTSPKYALECINKALAFFEEGSRFVDACSAINRNFASCVAPKDKNNYCSYQSAAPKIETPEAQH